MDGKIEYCNTDLELISRDDLTELASALAAIGVAPLHVTLGQDGQWYSWLETEQSFDEPESNIGVMMDAIESLSAPMHAAWERCSHREFNIGYDCGDEPWAFNQGLTNKLLVRIAASGASLRWTLYPDRPDSTEESGIDDEDKSESP
ncbi:MAG TPA: hypothetical protein VFG20_19030 [Planctomycetaceae bacterium]|nr:hypothetical protein [Planctomycetaceae bacterium]